MSKNIIEIGVVIGERADSVQVAKVVMVKKGDLYISLLAPDLITGKHSYHESGVSHTYVDLIKGRSGEGQPAGQKLRGMTGHLLVDGWGCPSVPERTGYQPKPDTKVRRTLIAPKADIGFNCYVWAIERGRKDLAEKISHTNPWPEIPVVASLLADWSDPWILVTVCHWRSDEPYQVVKYSPPIPGRVPYVLIPDAFEGTWLERPGPKWRPGEPFPEEWLRERAGEIAEGYGLLDALARRSSQLPIPNTERGTRFRSSVDYAVDLSKETWRAILDPNLSDYAVTGVYAVAERWSASRQTLRGILREQGIADDEVSRAQLRLPN